MAGSGDTAHADARTRSAASVLMIATAVAFAVTALSLVVPLTGGAAAARGSVAALSELTAATTHTTLRQAPSDPKPQQATQGVVVHPTGTLRLYDEPGGRAFGKIGPRQMGPTWLPAIDTDGGWTRVLLPSRPNGATGWLRTSGLERRSTPYLIRVHLASRTLELFEGGRTVGSWPVAVGAPGTPTPTGRTFLLGSIVDEQQSFSPLILPLGTHSNTLDSYGGGPGTVALHGWPEESVFGSAVSHGCIRVPAAALERLSRVPLGTLVIVDEA